MWHFVGAAARTKRLLSKTRDVEREQIRRLNEAYAHWRTKKSRVGKQSVQDRRLLGVRDLGLTEHCEKKGRRSEQR